MELEYKVMKELLAEQKRTNELLEQLLTKNEVPDETPAIQKRGRRRA